MKKVIRRLIIFILYVLFIFLLLYNKSREKPTFSWFPQFVYIEHFLAGFLICLAIFSIFCFILIRLKKKKFKKEIIFFSAIAFSIGLYGGLATYYDYSQFVNSGNFKQLIQALFNILGISFFLWYVKRTNREIWKRGFI